MSHYKLHYFNFKGRAESTRILLTLAGADWEDIRDKYVYRGESWKGIKESGLFPYGQLPVMEVDGTVLAQSMAILRYLAREHGFLPDTSLKVAIADGIVDQIQDCLQKWLEVDFKQDEEDEDKKEKSKKEFYENFLPKNIKNFEKILKENCHGKPFFFGNKITFADIHVFDFANNCFACGKLEVPELLNGFPHLTKLYNAVMNEPTIRTYLENRPQSKM